MNEEILAKSVRRCQGWKLDGWEYTVVIQCDQPAVDGLKCEAHKDQVPEVWMPAP